MLQRLRRAWNDFFFTPQSTMPLSLFRIAWGLCVMGTLLLAHGDWLQWYGVHSWITAATQHILEPGTRLNLFSLLPADDSWISAFYWISLACAFLTTIGLWTRLSMPLTFLCLASIHQRNLIILHGGDTFLRVAGFFLIFSPSGNTLSLDAFLKRRRHPQSPHSQSRMPWAQRMIQCQLALLYITACLWKLKGHAWLGGTALYYVTHLQDLQRFPVAPWIATPLVLKLGSWFTLVLEFALGTAIWWKRTRYPMLLLGIAFHLTLEYTLNVPMFQWDILAAYILFVDPRDLERWRLNITSLLGIKNSASPRPTGRSSRPVS